MKKFLFGLLLVVCVATNVFAGHQDFNRLLFRTDLAADVLQPVDQAVTTLFTLPVTFPTRQGPWRVRISYSILVGTGNANTACQAWVDDQQPLNNVFGDSQRFILAQNSNALTFSGFSKNTYGNATTVTFLVKVQCAGSAVSIFTSWGFSSTTKTHFELAAEPD